MVGIIGKIVGLALVNPVSLVLGGLLTVRTVRDLRKQSLNQRRHTTKVDGQKYIQELALVARKENGDRLERIRRQLRDRYQQRAKEHQEAMAAALATAKADAQRSDAERTARRRRHRGRAAPHRQAPGRVVDERLRRADRAEAAAVPHEQPAAGRRAVGARPGDDGVGGHAGGRRGRRAARAGSTSRCGSPSPAR